MAEKPKRPLPAYLIWLHSIRDELRRENPDMKVTEIAKKGGEMWRAMKDKSEWEAKAIQAKEDYEVAMREFKENGGNTSGYGSPQNDAKVPTMV